MIFLVSFQRAKLITVMEAPGKVMTCGRHYLLNQGQNGLDRDGLQCLVCEHFGGGLHACSIVALLLLVVVVVLDLSHGGAVECGV